MPRLATLVGGLLLSRMAGRNMGKLALGALAWRLLASRRRRR